MSLYFIDAYDKQFKIDTLSLGVYGVNKKLMDQRVKSDNESLQFLWISALVSVGPMLVIGWITSYIYTEFFNNSSWGLSCGPRNPGQNYTLCGLPQGLDNICCDIEYSTGFPSYLDFIIRVVTTFIISWGLVKFVAEWILNSEAKVNDLESKHWQISVENLQRLLELQEAEKNKVPPPPSALQGVVSDPRVGEKTLTRLLQTDVLLHVPAPEDIDDDDEEEKDKDGNPIPKKRHKKKVDEKDKDKEKEDKDKEKDKEKDKDKDKEKDKEKDKDNNDTDNNKQPQ